MFLLASVHTVTQTLNFKLKQNKNHFLEILTYQNQNYIFLSFITSC